MSGSCIWIPKVKRADGAEVNSKLFIDLQEAFKTRSKVVEYYYAAINPDFVSKYHDEMKFDENGEVTLHSLIKLVDLGINDDYFKEKYNKELQAGTYSYVEALTKVNKFNKKYGTESEFLGMLEPTKDGKFKIFVEKTSDENIEKLEANIANQEKVNRMIEALQKAGVTYDFSDTKTFNGRYSTLDAKRASDGMYHLITLSRSNVTNRVFLEEGFHFAVASLKNTDKVQRLLRLCKNDDLIKTFGLYTEEDILDKSHEESAARVLLKSYLGEEIPGYNNFVSRVIKFIKDIFKGINPFSFNAAMEEAQELATSIVEEFFEGYGDVKVAIEGPEVLFNRSTKDSIDIIQSVKKELLGLKNNLSSISIEFSKKFTENASISDILNGNNSDHSLIGISEVTSNALSELLTVLDEQLSLIQKAKEEDIKDDSRYGDDVICSSYPSLIQKTKYIYETITALSSTLMTNIANMEYENKAVFEPLMEKVTASIESQVRSLPNNQSINTLLNNESIKLSSAIMRKFLGSDGIAIEGKVDYRNLAKLWNGYVSSEDLVTKIYGTDSTITSWLNVCVQTSDLSLSTLNEFIRNEDAEIKRELSNWRGLLEEYKETAKKLYKSTDDLKDLIALDDKGNSTGNFISKYNRHIYEERKKKIIQEIVAKAEKYIKENPEEFLDTRAKNIYKTKRIIEDEELQAFEDNSFITDENGVKRFNPDFEDGIYVNKEYAKLSSSHDKWVEEGKSEDSKYYKEALKFELLNNILMFKESIDNLFYTDEDGTSHGVYERIPQFSTKRASLFRGFNKYKGLLGSFFDDFEVGTDIDELENKYINESLGVMNFYKKVPIVGIRKIKNPTTNIFASLEYYAFNAIRYNRIKKNVAIMSILESTLNSRDRIDDEYAYNTSLIKKITDKIPALRKFRPSKESIKDQFKNTQSLTTDSISYYLYGVRPSDSTLKSIVNTVIGGIASAAYLMRTLGWNLTSSFINFLSAVNMWIFYAPNTDTYKLGTFIWETTKAMFNSHYKIPIIKHFGKTDKDIMNYINGIKGSQESWRIFNRKSLLEDALVTIPMQIYSKPDEIVQHAIYMSAFSSHQGFNLNNINNDGSLFNGKYNIRRLKRKLSSRLFIRGKMQSLKNIFGKETSENSEGRHGLFIKKGFLKNKEDVINYCSLYNIREEILNALANNSKAENNRDIEWTKKSIEDIFNDSNLEEELNALDNLGIMITDDEDNLKILEQVLSEVEEAMNNMEYKESDIVNLVNEVLQESTEQQGLYYANVKNKVLEATHFKGGAIFLGFALGFYNKNFNSNYNALDKEYKVSRLEAIAYSWARLFTGTVDVQTEKMRGKNIWEILSVLALNTPVVQYFTHFNKIEQRLIQLGYSKQLIRRLRMTGMDWLKVYIFFLLKGMLSPRKIDDIKTDLNKGDSSKVNEFYDYKLPLGKKLAYQLVHPFTASHLLYDLCVEPSKDEEKAKNALYHRFKKKGEITDMVINHKDYENNVSDIIDLVCDGLAEIEDKLDKGTYTNVKDLYIDTFSNLGFKRDDIIDFYNKSANIRVGSKNDILEYEEFLSANHLSDSADNKASYNRYVKSKNDKIYKKFNLSLSEDVRTLSANLKAVALSAYSYDKSSPEYKYTGLAYYLVGREMIEGLSAASMKQNITDLGNLNFLFRTDVLEELRIVSNSASTLYKYGFKEGYDKLKKKALDNILKKFLLETDKFGNIFEDEENEESTGYSMIDYFQAFNKYENFRKNGK